MKIRLMSVISFHINWIALFALFNEINDWIKVVLILLLILVNYFDGLNKGKQQNKTVDYGADH